LNLKNVGENPVARNSPGKARMANEMGLKEFESAIEADCNSTPRRWDELDVLTKALIRKKLSAIPEVRMEKVLEVKRQIEKGEYETKDKINIAIDRILKEILG